MGDNELEFWFPRDGTDDIDDLEDYSDEWKQIQRDIESVQLPVLTMLHICQNSGAAALKVY